MKKALLSGLAAAAIIMASAFTTAGEAEAPDAEEINCLIEEGSYIVQIPVKEDDEGWKVNDMELDESVLKVYSAEVIEDTFVARIDPAADGTATLEIDHYDGIACDRRLTWDLVVEGGEVKECTGGSNEEAPDEESMDAYLSGVWMEDETQFTRMEIARNPEKGWDVEIISPASHGAYVTRAVVYYDCMTGALIYNNGAVYEVPITDSEESELGDPVVENAKGMLKITGDDEENIRLGWTHDDDNEVIVFVRAAEE